MKRGPLWLIVDGIYFARMDFARKRTMRHIPCCCFTTIPNLSFKKIERELLRNLCRVKVPNFDKYYIKVMRIN